MVDIEPIPGEEELAAQADEEPAPPEVPEDLVEDAPPGEEIEEPELREEVADILASLPQQKREVAILCYLDGVSRKDAARFLGISETALRKRLHDAKRLLQREIVEAAEKSLEEHLLPKGFASRCVCGCKHALDANR